MKGYKRNLKTMLKLLFSAGILIFVVCSSFSYAYAEETTGKSAEEIDSNEIMDKQYQSNEIQNIQNELEKRTNNEVNDILQNYDPRSIIKDAAQGKFELSFKSIANNALRFLFKEIYTNLDILIKLIVLIVLCALLRNLQTSFLSEGVSEIAFYVCYIVIVSILLVSFSTAMQMGMSMIDGMVDFMYATTPVLITLLVSGGNITSGGIFQPLMLMIVEVSATIMKTVFIPMIFLSTILSIVSNISDKIHITRLTAMLKQITAWALGTIMTIFIAVVSLQGSLGAVIDGVTSKTAKFAIGTFIPVVGKTLADAADTVIGCTLLIKNAAGVAVMVGVLIICIVPLLKILALVALYKAASALVEPISEKRITNCISDVAGSMVYIFGISAAVGFMFLITITALISAGNLSAMIR